MYGPKSFKQPNKKQTEIGGVCLRRFVGLLGRGNGLSPHIETRLGLNILF